MALHPHPSTALLPKPGLHSTPVTMITTGPYMRETLAPSPTSTLWTDSIADCCAIAAYHPGRNERSLIHLTGGGKGGDQTNAYYASWVSRLAARHDQNSTFVVVGGAN